MLEALVVWISDGVNSRQLLLEFCKFLYKFAVLVILSLMQKVDLARSTLQQPTSFAKVSCSSPTYFDPFLEVF